jgi:photosystem II stability/assembly factor-like uncharacterized protein
VLRAVLALAVILTVVTSSGEAPASAHSPHDTVVDVATSPQWATDGTAYAIVREYLLRSDDRGDTWTRLHHGLDNKSQLSSIEVSQQDPSRLFVGSRGDGVFRSDDGGARWRRAATGLEATSVRFLWMSPHDHDVLYVAAPTVGLRVTTDGGGSWRPVPGFADRSVQALAFDADDPDRVLAGSTGEVFGSTDAGASWSSVGRFGDGEVTALALAPGGPGEPAIFAGTGEGLYRRDGDGAFELLDGDLADDAITAVSIDDELVVAVSWTRGPFTSRDGGDSWSLDDDELTTTEMAADLGHPDFNGIASGEGADGEHTYFLGGYDGLFRSSDPSGGWEQLVTQDSMYLTALALSPNYADDGTLLATTYLNGPKISFDRGATWTSLTPGLAFRHDYLREPDYYVRLTGSFFAPDYATTKQLYATSRGFLFATTDHTTPWRAQPQFAIIDPDDVPPDYLLTAFSPAYAEDRTLLAGTDDGAILRKVGDGDFAEVGDLGAEVTAFAPSPDFGTDGVLFAATPKGLFAGTIDDGLELLPGSPKDLTTLAVSPALGADGTIFVGSKRGLAVSKDRGKTWADVPWSGSGGRRPFVESVVLSPSYGEDGFVLVSERGNGLFRSTDGGTTFESTGVDLLDRNAVLGSFYHPTGEPIAFSPDFAEDRTIFGTSDQVLYRSTDAGRSWTALEIPRETHPLTEESAPNDLLRTPTEAGEHAHGKAPRAPGTTAVASTTLLLTTKRVLIAAVAALAVVVALSLARVGKKARPEVLVIGFRVACGLLVFLAAIVVLGRRT